MVVLLEGKPYEAFNSDQRIFIPAAGLNTYADGGVVCGVWQIHSDDMCLLNPVLLFEVLSPSTREYDMGAKRQHYEQIPSLRHLLLIDRPDRRVWHHVRQPSGAWSCREIASGAIDLPDLGGSIRVEALHPRHSL